jgi:hypothetical protein
VDAFTPLEFRVLYHDVGSLAVDAIRVRKIAPLPAP